MARNLFEALIERHEAGKISHTESDVDHITDSSRQPGTNLHNVCFVSTEDTDGTPGFIAVKAVRVRIVLAGVEVVTHHALGVFEGEFAFGLHKYAEFAAVFDGLNHRRIEELLDLPNARIVVNTVTVVVACVSSGEIERTFLRIIEAVSDGKVDQVGAAFELGSVRIVKTRRPDCREPK